MIVTNVGNVPYRKSIQISIGNNQETIFVPLEFGQKKELKLTAPDGSYDIKVNDSILKYTGRPFFVEELKEKLINKI